ncbi:MAG: hypothetical protein O3B21_02855 [Proteobacteria bacterium]|nr:hypothetical protein [Pseudomonadota bacterium]MDA1354737.1 hypothetical protein [Pseudomonadota bacterium]
MKSAPAKPTESPSTSTDVDVDSLHILPLSIVPLYTTGLKQARLIKNTHFKSVIEIYKGAKTGSGQIEPDALSRHFNWQSAEDLEDQRLIEHLARLHSYDVYSLRIELRRAGIELAEVDALQLSPAKQAELTEYMRVFTSPLLAQVYGGSNAEIENFDQLIGMFSNPDREVAIRNLRTLARQLEIEVSDVPEFLEEYADIFLSLAYFKNCLDELIPKIGRFIEVVREVECNFHMRRDPILMHVCGFLRENLNDVTASLTGRFESFDRHSKDMWENLNGESFRRVRRLIESHHTTVGGVLCGLSLKMGAWENEIGWECTRPMQRAEFITSQMRSGLNRIKEIEDSAPTISDI